MERTVLRNVNVRMGHHVIRSLESVTVLLDGWEKCVMKVSQHTHYKIMLLNFKVHQSFGILLACTDGFYGRNCSQMCNCIEKNQNRPCNRMNGECYCLSNYTGLRCEILTSTETPTQSNRAAIIAGATVGSAFVLLLLIALVVIIAVTIQVLVTHVHKTRDLRLRVSPSQQFENQIQLQNVTNYDKSLGAPPLDEQIPPTEAEMTTETSTDVEITKIPLP